MDRPGVEAALQPCTSTFQVTVFRSRETKQVLFLEAGKDFVDTLFSFLVLPMGTIVNILSQGKQLKSVGGISCMFESLDPSFLQVDKKSLVESPPSVAGCICQPRTSVKFQQGLVSAEMMQPSQHYSPTFYSCSKTLTCAFSSHSHLTVCEVCSGYNINRYYDVKCAAPYFEMRHIPTVQVNGFVKENIRFIVTDKLEIFPSSIGASMSLLTKLGIALVDDPESNEITVCFTQIVELLHSALISKNCLNDVFGKK